MNFNTNQNNNGRQQNQRYTPQNNQKQQSNNNDNYNNNRRNNYRRQPRYQPRNDIDDPMYYQNRQHYDNDALRNVPMYGGDMNDYSHSQYPPMFGPPQYYDPNASYNPAMNIHMGSGVSNQIGMNAPQPKSTNVASNTSNIKNNNVNKNNTTSPTFNIIVNNLPDYYNVDHLIQQFAPYGPIQSVNIQKSTTSKQSTGIVSYFYFDDAQRAQSQTNGKRVEPNQRLEVVFQAIN